MTNSSNLLTGSKLEYRYEDGSIASIKFADESLDVEWLSGPFKGAKRTDLKYNYRELGNDRCLVNWHDLEGPGFVTLLIEIGAGKVYGSAILGYNSDEHIELFDEATILNFSSGQ